MTLNTDSQAAFAGYHSSSGADSWFRNIAQPVIAAHILGEHRGS